MKKYSKYIIIGIILFLIILICSIVANNSDELNDENIVTDKISTSISTSIVSNKIMVDVKGAVKKAGVYVLKEGDRVIDAINAAGGLSKNGVTNNINLSKVITNEMVIYVFTKNELKTVTTTQRNDVPCICETIEVNNCIANDENNTIETTTSAFSTTKSIANNKVNINVASIEELTTISGIGESKAKSIIEYRNANGSFKNIEDITKVNGIGESLFAKIKDYITV